MKLKSIEYSKVFNLGNYSNEKIGVEIEIQEGDDVNKCFQQAREYVEFNHKLNGLSSELSQCQYVVNHPDEFTGRQVKQAQERIDAINNEINRGTQLLLI